MYHLNICRLLYKFLNLLRYIHFLPVAGLAKETRLYVISKVWCCKQLDIVLTLSDTSKPNDRVDYTVQQRAGEENFPYYGIPICFQYSKYPMIDGQLHNRVECNLKEGKKGTWLRRKEFPLFDGIPWPEVSCSK